jgi:hypothetical protein
VETERKPERKTDQEGKGMLKLDRDVHLRLTKGKGRREGAGVVSEDRVS